VIVKKTSYNDNPKGAKPPLKCGDMTMFPSAHDSLSSQHYTASYDCDEAGEVTDKTRKEEGETNNSVYNSSHRSVQFAEPANTSPGKCFGTRRSRVS
jgi:hypothetical protein